MKSLLQVLRRFDQLILFMLAAICLFLGFDRNLWRVADQNWFDNFQRDSESIMIGRLVESRQMGIFSAGGLTGLGTLGAVPINQYVAYSYRLNFGTYTTYNSQIGMQGMFFSLLDRIVPLDPQTKLDLFHAINSLLAACVLSVLIIWFDLEFGLTVSLFVFASALFSQWLTVFGRNLWWSLWAFFIPMVVFAFYLRRNRGVLHNKSFDLGMMAFSVTLLKCLFNGYEYITTALIMMTVPYIYYSVLERIRIRKFVAGITSIFAGSIFAVLFTFLILIVQIASVQGNVQAGIDHIVYSFLKRSYAPAADLPASFAPGLEANPFKVLATYLVSSSYFDLNNYLTSPNDFVGKYLFRVRYLPLILLFLLMSGVVYFGGRRKGWEDSQRALLAATWFSILAPLSWLIIFKAHSYVHTHINYIVWQMPFVFFGFAICGTAVKSVAFVIVKRLPAFRLKSNTPHTPH